MDVAWLILDSLSFGATPFCEDGSDTMPKISSLAEESGVVFTKAYVPGPTSPSSHGSFFTGEPPSVTGMHEAFPYFESDIETIGEALSDTHKSMLISANPYIFNGLDRGFDITGDLREEDYMVFSDARDPAEFGDENDYGSKLVTYLKFLTESDNPLKSMINGIQYKRVMKKRRSSLPESSPRDRNKFQYANEMNVRIREFIQNTYEDTFVVANYMDIHPPLDASQEALERFSGQFSPNELPVGVRGQDVYEKYSEGNNEITEKMYSLLKATIWDTDRKVGSLISHLLERDTFVVLTADHGIWFRRSSELDEERIHVPLIIFSPDDTHRTVDHTVNIQSLPKTTLSALNRHGEKEFEGEFEGRDLLDIDGSDVSVTEFIYTSDEDGKPINPGGSEIEEVNFDMAAVYDDDRLDYLDKNYVEKCSNENLEKLRDETESRLSNTPTSSEKDIEYDETVKQRLKDFGYM